MEVQKGVELIKQAQKLDKSHPLVNLQLAEVLFHKGNLDRSLEMSKNALRSANGAEIVARALYQIGRVYQQNVCLS